jgi:hypothetical protein
MSESRKESVEVGELSIVKGSESEAMMRVRDCGAMGKQLGSWRVFYTPPVRAAELLKQYVQVGKKSPEPSEGKSVCNRLVASLPENEWCIQ